ncbi:PAS domain S-box protein [Leptolyngbya cf. ectocarpi LEGE 11479]|uniref:histidine kinase n=1 Tax=Leptolyngbya cf. ectocarpi LEGE 11479 TaxID=1828722 RepID=A0A928ZRD3_LEPEC|nr:PAS domain S-box protein [Leptolyngbya ectocarpi]MBE9067240.1 PAS domain S-box protein [Leptolyngbya cf. ectocarpi LEGE 11479]
MPVDSPDPNTRSLADRVVTSTPLMVTPETLIGDAIAIMHQAQTSYVLIAEQQRPVGIFTERDLVELIASGQSITNVPIAAVMTTAVQTITTDQVNDTLVLFHQMLQYQVRHLPIVDEQERLVGMITQSSLLQALNPNAIKQIFERLSQEAEPPRSVDQALARNLELEQAQTRLSQQLEVAQTEHQFAKSLNSALRRDQVRLSTQLQAEQIEIQQAEAHILFQSRLLDAVAQAVIATNLDGNILYWNCFAETLYGWSAAEVLGRSILDITPADTTRDQAVEIMAHLQQGEQWSGEFWVKRKDGTPFPAWVIDAPIYDDQGILVGVVGVSMDISDRKRIESERQQAEQALQQANANLENWVEVRTADLRQAEQRWRTLLENVHLAVVGLDCNGKVNYANPFLLNLTGYTATDVLGKDWVDLFLPPSQQPLVRSYFQQLLSQPNSTLRYQNPILTQSGEQRMIAWNNTVLRNGHSNIIGTMSIGEDITERFAIDRMKGEFISVISHELRTPLTAIHGGIKLLARGLVPVESEQGQQLLQLTAEHSQRLVRLVNDILELERLESDTSLLQKQPFNTQTLTSQVVGLFQLTANQAGITLEVSDPGFEIMADCDRIHQVLTNLMDNAIKFSPRNSTIWLTVESGESDPGRDTVLFTIRDQGRGIPPEKCAKIFERFIQVDSSDSREKGGTGLGLTICQNIVEQHGGFIGVKSTPGKGSCFYFTLPIN